MEKKLIDEIKKMGSKTNAVEIGVCSDALSAIENLLVLKWEMIVIDIDLTIYNTLKIIHIIRLIDKSIPIILILSREHMPICLGAFSSNSVSYLLKPIVPQNLYEIIFSTLKVNR